MGVLVKIFIIGATGYVGGALLSRLLDADMAHTAHITVLSRSPSKARRLCDFGLEAVVGSLDDLQKLTDISSESDVVIQCADADHLMANKAILAGLKRRHEQKGSVPILIHTSGTAVLSDHAAGMYATNTIYNDLNLAQLDSIPPTQPHRDVELNIISADKEGYVKTYIILPSTIYGLASGALVDAGLMNPQSQQIPDLIRASMDRQQAGMVGAGKNFHPNVHIADIVDLYKLILDGALAGDDIGHGREGYYFGENGEHTMRRIADAMGDALYGLGLAPIATPSTFTSRELAKYFGGSESLGTNARCRAGRARAIGWKPRRSTVDMLASIKSEIEYILCRRR